MNPYIVEGDSLFTDYYEIVRDDNSPTVTGEYDYDKHIRALKRVVQDLHERIQKLEET